MFEKEANEYAKEVTKKYVFMEHGRASALGFQKGAEFGYNKGNEELEEKISVLLSCKNCPENKDGLICRKEYENKCLAQKIQYIKELKEENAELKGQIEKKMEEIRTDNTETLKNALERIAELEKEKAELKEQCSIFDKSLVTSTKNNIERQKIIDEIKEQLTKAKEIIEELYNIIPASMSEYAKEPMEHARKFMTEE